MISLAFAQRTGFPDTPHHALHWFFISIGFGTEIPATLRPLGLQTRFQTVTRYTSDLNTSEFILVTSLRTAYTGSAAMLAAILMPE